MFCRLRILSFVSEAAISKTFRITLASPFDESIKNLLALGLILILRNFNPRVIILPKSSAVSWFITRTRHRERRAEIISKPGFSVVAPMRIISPRSTCGRSLSCWALFQRWISSRKIIGWISFCWWPASIIIFCMSLVLVLTAENSWNSRSSSVAIIRARVVLPEPGGPQKMREGKNLFALEFLRRVGMILLVPTR